MKFPKVGSPVMVEWKDAAGMEDWGSRPDIPALSHTVSFGVLRYVDKHRINLAATHGTDRQNVAPWGQRSVIPRRSVVRVRRLRW